jgi:2-(1,2-epoxy-1,2-dihydrophenyl)acetyl-CoA isomerase
MAYSGVGLTPDCGVSWLRPRAVGQQRALELALTGRVLSATEARDWGLVNEVAPDEAVTDKVRAVAARLCDGPVFAHGQAKRLLRTSWDRSRVDAGTEEARTIARAIATPEAQSMITAFAAKHA